MKLFSIFSPSRRRRRDFSRASARYACTIEGTLMMMDRVVSFPGRVIDLSAGGALFRPRLSYLLNRRDVPICLTLGSEELFGKIVSTTPKGFGINFDEPIAEETLQAILSEAGDGGRVAA
jgi:hypothetical protein